MMPLATSIFTAAQLGDLPTVQEKVRRNPALVNLCDSYGYTPLHYASQSGFDVLVQFLLSCGAEADGGQCGATALHRTAYAGHEKCCRLLLEAGASVDLPDSSFGDLNTAAHKAVLGGHAHLLPLFSQYGAKMDIVNAEGKTVSDLLREHQEKVDEDSVSDGSAMAQTSSAVNCDNQPLPFADILAVALWFACNAEAQAGFDLTNRELFPGLDYLLHYH
eukprot:gene5349-5885_t